MIGGFLLQFRPFLKYSAYILSDPLYYDKKSHQPLFTFILLLTLLWLSLSVKRLPRLKLYEEMLHNRTQSTTA